MNNKRKTEISLLNVLFCLTVIFIHIISYAVSSFTPGTVEYTIVMIPWRLATFVVQGFVMLSGVKLFLNGREQKPYSKHLTARLKDIVKPYAICFVIYYIYFMIAKEYPPDLEYLKNQFHYIFTASAWYNIPFMVRNLFQFIIVNDGLNLSFILKNFFNGGLVYHLYFIPLILQFDVLLPVWKRLVNKYSPVAVLPVTLLITLFCEAFLPQIITTLFPNAEFTYNDRIFSSYLAFWLIGCYIGKYYDKFCEILKKHFPALCTFYGITLILVTVLSYFAFNNIVNIPYLNIIHFLYVIFTLLFLYAVSIKIPQNIFEKIPILSKIDHSSLYIYLYHVLPLMIIHDLLVH